MGKENAKKDAPKVEVLINDGLYSEANIRLKYRAEPLPIGTLLIIVYPSAPAQE